MDDFPQPSAPVSGRPDRGHPERIRWRPWPCQSCHGGQTPRDYLGSRFGTGRTVLEAEWEERSRAEIDQLIRWASGCPHVADQELTLPRLAEGSEHRVFVAPGDLVYKQTLAGTFGDTYFIVNGRVHQRRCLPSDYLARLELWDEVFGYAPVALGLTPNGQFVTVQAFIEGEVPSQQEVDEFLWAFPLVDVKRQCYVWKQSLPTRDIWVGDTRDENFVKTPLGIVPIDVRLWIQD